MSGVRSTFLPLPTAAGSLVFPSGAVNRTRAARLDGAVLVARFPLRKQKV
ncbi:MAG: hypothetical protein ACRDTX_11135 [Pseudonocardiaceae bacterium]